MKSVTKQIMIPQTEVIFVADDGTTFRNEEECKKYEESASFVAKKRLVDGEVFFPIKHGYKEETTGAVYFGLDMIFGCCDDYDFYLFKPENEEDIRLFLQWVKLEIEERCMVKHKARTKENYQQLTERLLVDDSADWEKYRQTVDFDEIVPGKSYIFYSLDGYGDIFETEKLKTSYCFVVDTLVKQFSK